MKPREHSDTVTFEWSVPVPGHKWVRGFDPEKKLFQRKETKPGWYLIETWAQPYSRRIYAPLTECSGLFRTFSELKPNRANILQFANRYGRLGTGFVALTSSREENLAPGGDALESRKVQAGDSYNIWVREILLMKDLVALWDAARGSNAHALGELLEWKPNGDLVHYQSRRQNPLTRRSVLDCHLDRCKFPLPRTSRDLMFPALNLLRAELNTRLAKGFSMFMNNTESGFELSIKPTRLLSAIWLQFASAIARNSTLRSCLGCRRWFQVGAGADMRADAKYCSNACRQRFYRNKKRAQE